VIVGLLWAHVVALPIFALVRGYSLAHGLVETVPVAAAAAFASAHRAPRKALEAASALGLLTSSAVIVHLSGGTVEAHFHFFVVVGVLTMYEDWFPFLLAIGYVLVHHGIMGQFDPTSVYNHPAAIAHPWTWAAIHAVFVLGASAVLVASWRMNEDIRYRLARSLKELQHADGERRQLLERVVHAREDEDRRISAELHDGPIQRLTRLDYLAERAALRMQAGNVESAVEFFVQIQEGLRDEIKDLRRLMTELRPSVLEQRGLVPALQAHIDSLGGLSGLNCSLDARVRGQFQPTVEAAMYRVVQEALTNVVKHAQAEKAKVSLETVDGEVVLTVVDNGKGFEPGQVLGVLGSDHFGLIAMRERVLMEGGECEIRSLPGRGTEVHVSFPRSVALR